MFNTTRIPAAVLFALALTLSAGPVQAKGRIICWKDKSGRTVGCGDRVPPEYQDNATKELDKHGITRKTTESDQQAEKLKSQQQALARKHEEENRQRAAQQRQDAALINTFTSEQEIDLKRDRDLQVVELQIKQLKLSLKDAINRKTVEQEIANKEKVINDIRARYAEYKKRYAELKGLPPPVAAPTPAAAAPQKK
jgi:phage-related minor tail protein